MLNPELFLSENNDAYLDTNIVKLVEGRHEKFLNYLSDEVILYVKNHYKTLDQDKWTLGGFSNGGAFVFSFSSERPVYFGNAIIMSPAGQNNYDILQSKCNYFICAGNIETGFYDNSLEYLPLMEENNITFIHKTYYAGHDWLMWKTFYLDSIKTIYHL